MTAVKNKNLEVLKTRFPEEYKYFKSKKNKCIDDISVHIENGYDDKPVPFVSKGDKSYQLDLLHDNSDYLDMWYKSLINNALVNVYVFYGLGNGMYARYLLNHSKEDDIVCVYEPDAQIFQVVIENFDISDILSDDRFKIGIGDITRFSVMVDSSVDYIMKQTVNSCLYPNYENIYENDSYTYIEKIKNVYASTIITMNTIQSTSKYWYTNVLKNVPYFKSGKSLLDFMEKFDKDIPVIIVSSGPSLDKNVDLLPDAKGKAIIVAVDSSLPALLSRNIIPDLFVSIDGRKKEAHFKDERVNDIPVFGSIESVPYVYNKNKSNYLIDKYFMKFFGEVEVYPFPPLFRGCVSGTALIIFLEMGFKNIILVGQDLAYTGDKDHAGGILNDIAEDNSVTYCYVDDINGEKVRTTYQMASYIGQFEIDINSHKKQKVIDATEGGAKINGAVIMTLEKAIKKYCKDKEINFVEVESTVETQFSEEQQKAFIEYFDGLEQNFDEIIKNLKKAINLYSDLLKEVKTSYKPARIKKLFEDANKVSGKISKNRALNFVELMNADAARELKDEINLLKDDEKEELIATSEHGIKHAESMLKAAKEAKEIYMENRPSWDEWSH